MSVPSPHFLLIAGRGSRERQEDWRFTVQSDDGQPCFEVADFEPEVHGERLELLAVIRGLESFDQPSRVTLFTDSSYVSRGLNYGLAEWRDNNWQWERHGSMVPVKDSDLWKRLDRTLQIPSGGMPIAEVGIRNGTKTARLPATVAIPTAGGCRVVGRLAVRLT